MKHNYFFDNGRVFLRPLLKDDIEDLRVCRNSCRNSFVNSNIIDTFQQQQWYDNYLHNNSDIMFSVFDKDSNRIGYVALTEYNNKQNSAELSRLLVIKEKRGKNFGREIIECLINFASSFLEIRILFCRCLVANEKALDLYRRIGFDIVGENDVFYTLKMNDIKTKINIKIAFVILHYNNLKDTLECVKSIKDNIDTKDYIILVFDNCSPNGSGKELNNVFDGFENVEIYLNDCNLGFGAGNNKGIEIIRNKYNPEYIVLSNNDIVLNEKSFSKKIDEEYKISNFAELGPMIKTADGKYISNPIFDRPFTRYDATYALKQSKMRLFAHKTHTYWLYSNIRYLCFRLFPYFRKHKPKPRKYIFDSYKERKVNAILHGCFMVFSREFFKYYDGIDVRNFMYAEEDIIYAQIMSKGLKTVYVPDILVYHKEGQSVSNTYGKDRKKEIFLLERYIEAEKGYLSLLDDLEKEGFTFKEDR